MRIVSSIETLSNQHCYQGLRARLCAGPSPQRISPVAKEMLLINNEKKELSYLVVFPQRVFGATKSDPCFQSFGIG